MDALKIQKAIIGGFDWGGRTADIIAILWPERCKALVSVSGYLVSSQASQHAPLPPAAELQWWYQFYFSTERGRAGYDKYRHDFSKLIWKLASPKWNFDDATFDRTAASFENADHVAIVIHDYAFGSDSLKAKRNMTIWKRSLPKFRQSPCPQSRWKVTPMARRIRTPVPTPINSPANMRAGSSPAASATTCRKKLRRILLKRSSMSMLFNLS